MIVPVSASFWPRELPPVDLEKSCPIYGDDDVQAEYHQILFDEPRCPEQNTQLKLSQRTSADRPLPQLANVMGINLGFHVFDVVEDAMKLKPGGR